MDRDGFRPKRVFLSYTHDSPEHKARVLGLSDRLIRDGVDARIDRYVESFPPRSWPRWMAGEIEDADFVLVICTGAYNKRFRDLEEPGIGKGVRCEGAVIIQELYEADAARVKFIPVAFSSEDCQSIPIVLRGTTHYILDSEDAYERLYRHITGQPCTPRPQIGQPVPLAPEQRGPLIFDAEPLFPVFERAYRRLARSYHQWMLLPDYRRIEKCQIDNIYVSQFLDRAGEGNEPSKERFTLGQFCSRAFRATVLGNPGEGKSAFAQKLCYDLSEPIEESRFQRSNPLPFLVVLREYGVAKRMARRSVVQFIEESCQATLQLALPQGAIETLLIRGRAVVVFDGLDELVNVAWRREIADAIEMFARRYPNAPMVVTSRIQGYDLAPLSRDLFDVYELAGFEPEQIEKYASNWFRRDSSLSGTDLKAKVGIFASESALAGTLRTNPLMLGLMCNLFSEKRTLPQNRCELLRQSSEMFFSRRDKDRGIGMAVPSSYLRSTTQFLAHWIYEDKQRQANIREADLTTAIAGHLEKEFSEHRDTAEALADQFIFFYTDRCWLLSFIGSSDKGERLYQFTHRVFLEYFTAAEIVRLLPATDKLAAFFIPKIVMFEWCEVAEFALQLVDARESGKACVFLHNLLDTASKDDSYNRRIRPLYFAASCTSYLRLDQSTSSALCNAYSDWSTKCIAARLETDGDLYGKDHEMASLVMMMSLRRLVWCSDENLPQVAAALGNALSETITNGDRKEAFLAYEAANCIPYFLEQSTGKERRVLWDRTRERIVKKCERRLIELSKSYLSVCSDMLNEGGVSLLDLVNWHGVDGLFRYPHMLYDEQAFLGRDRGVKRGFCRNSFALSTLGSLLLKPMEPRLVRMLSSDLVSEVVQLLVGHPRPWVRRPVAYAMILSLDYTEKGKKAQTACDFPELPPDGLFLAFLLYAVLLEDTEAFRDEPYLVPEIKASELPFHSVVRWQLVGRFEAVQTETIEQELRQCKYDEPKRDIVWKWIRKEVSFTSGPTAKVGGTDDEAEMTQEGS